MATRTKRQRVRMEGSDAEDDHGEARARRHVARACCTCRESHGKCDGKEPICGSCKVHNRECRYSKTIDRRRRHDAAMIDELNQRILQLELENRELKKEVKQLRDYYRQNQLDVDQAVPPGPMLTITVPSDTPSDFYLRAGGNHQLEGSPFTSSAPSSPWSMGPPSPWSQRSPSPQPEGQYLDVPTTSHVRIGFGTDDESQTLPPDKAGHMSFSLPGMYGNGLAAARSTSSSPYNTSSSSLAPSPYMGTNVSTTSFAMPQGEYALEAKLETLNIQPNNATERQDVTAVPVFPEGGVHVHLLPHEPIIAPQAYSPFDFSSSVLMEGTSMDWSTQQFGTHMGE